MKGDTVLFHATQKMTVKQYSEFLMILKGSYYWAMDRDKLSRFSCSADNLILETKTGYDNHFEYHLVSVNGPREGNFKNACTYLAQLSVLKQSREVVKYLKEN